MPVADEREYAGYRFGVLLVALTLMLVWGACVDLLAPGVRPTVSKIVLGLVLTGMLLSAVYAVGARGRCRQVAWVLAVPALGLEVANVAWDGQQTHLVAASHVSTVVFLAYVAGIILDFIFRRRRVNTNTVFAALCVYLMLGIIWALVYALVEDWQPGSFSYPLGDRAQIRAGSQGIGVAVYYSFVTMTTLGYGDIVPVSRVSQSLSALQAILGQMYLTVLVAWLVGLHVAHNQGRGP